MAARRARLTAVLAVTAVLVALAAWGAVRLWPKVRDAATPELCTIGDYQLDPDQASVAATMVGAVTQYRTHLPERAAVLALGAALQESKLTNLPPGAGDRDSVGVLQQRPSQGWGGGKAATLLDVTEATTEFLDALVKIPNWQRLPLAEAVQAVQISADGSAYAQHEPEAQAIADALTGRTAAGITCEFPKPTKVASAARVAQRASQELGIDTPTAVGRTVRVPGAGWQTAAWFVANADRLGIEEVTYHGHHWTRSDGWRSGAASEAMVVATMFALKKTS